MSAKRTEPPSAWVLLIVALFALLIVVAKITYQDEAATPVVKRCVVLPLHGGGGMVTACEPERRP